MERKVDYLDELNSFVSESNKHDEDTGQEADNWEAEWQFRHKIVAKLTKQNWWYKQNDGEDIEYSQ